MAGRKLLNGEFDLTRISFPIKCMCPKTILQTIAYQACTMPIYLNYAASLQDPLERFKLVMIQSLNWYYYTSQFEKPLNPIVGETYQSVGRDGSNIFLEQTAHHPPTSHYLIEGPNKNYVFSGWLAFGIKSGLRQSHVEQSGHKQVRFKDGQTIRHNHHNDLFYNILYGTLTHQLFGPMEYHDTDNKLYGFFDFNKSRMKHQDYLHGEIRRDGEIVCKIKGNYMGYCEFDGVRLWDRRDRDQHFHPAETPFDFEGVLPSDSTHRADSIALQMRTVAEAQEEKEAMEVLQRHDRSLREQAQKRRDEGGQKYKQT